MNRTALKKKVSFKLKTAKETFLSGIRFKKSAHLDYIMIRLKSNTVPPLTGGGQHYVHVEPDATEQKFPNVFVAD